MWWSVVWDRDGLLNSDTAIFSPLENKMANWSWGKALQSEVPRTSRRRAKSAAAHLNTKVTTLSGVCWPGPDNRPSWMPGRPAQTKDIIRRSSAFRSSSLPHPVLLAGCQNEPGSPGSALWEYFISLHPAPAQQPAQLHQCCLTQKSSNNPKLLKWKCNLCCANRALWMPLCLLFLFHFWHLVPQNYNIELIFLSYLYFKNK